MSPHIYPYKTEAYLREAQGALSRMTAPSNGDDLKRALVSFLNASRFCLQQLVTEYKGVLVGFDEWWEEKGSEIGKNPVMSYFRQLRNRVIKAGEDVIDVSWEIKEPVHLKGPLQISPDGTVFVASSKTTAFTWVPKPVEQMEIMWKFKEHPEGYQEIPSLKLCQMYLEGLENIVGEFTERFGQIK